MCSPRCLRRAEGRLRKNPKLQGTPYIEHDFGPIFVIQAFVQKPFQHTAEYVMKFDIYPPLTSPTDFSTDFCALPEDRGPVGGAGGRTERHVAVLARPPCPHDTYPQFGSRGEEQGGTCWPSTAAPPDDLAIRGPHQVTCTPLHPKDGRFDPTSPTSIDSS